LLLFDKGFSELFGRNFNPQFLRTEVDLKLFCICSLEMVVGPLWKQGTYIFLLRLGTVILNLWP